MCISVQYVQGHETPAMSFVKLTSVASLPNVTGMIGVGKLVIIFSVYTHIF